MKSVYSSRLVRLLSAALLAIALTVPNLASAQTKAPAPAAPVEEFVSVDTLIVGCLAGGFSAGAAAVMPLITSYAAGGPTSVSTNLLAGWFGLGCATGIWAAAIAFATVVVLDAGKPGKEGV